MSTSDAQPPDASVSALHAPLEPARADDWIRQRVGRQILIGCATDLPEPLSALLARYLEIRIAPLPSATASAPELERALAALLPMEPHTLLFWLGAGELPTGASSLLYEVCDRSGALDACFVALVGPEMSRAVARRLAFEDGFAWPTEQSRLIGAILADAEAREDARRRGSSPPCYL